MIRYTIKIEQGKIVKDLGFVPHGRVVFLSKIEGLPALWRGGFVICQPLESMADELCQSEDLRKLIHAEESQIPEVSP